VVWSCEWRRVIEIGQERVLLCYLPENERRKESCNVGVRTDYLNVCNKIKKIVCRTYISLHVINYRRLLIIFVFTNRLPLQEF
jgi:hypothetical protein